jgi:hypothetical protein
MRIASPAPGEKEGRPATPDQSADLRIRPAQVSTADWKRALTELPAIFREGLTGTDKEKAHGMGLLAWAFEYENGPVMCSIDVWESGQQTVAGGIHRTGFPSAKTQGHILLWLQPRSSSAMAKGIRDRLGKDPKQTPDYHLGLVIDDGRAAYWSHWPGFNKPQVPLWFGWPKADVKQTADQATAKEGAEATMLRLEASDGAPLAPRGVQLVLKAKRYLYKP